MSSYKIIIADDEPMIRKGLECSVSWGKYGFEVVASFMDGQDVIDYLEHRIYSARVSEFAEMIKQEEMGI